MDVGGDISTKNLRYIWCACAALHQVNIQEVKKKKAKGFFFFFFFKTILLIYHQTFTVAFANSAPLNQVLKYKDSALQTNWILSMKIGHIIQRCACLLPYLKGGRRRATLCCLIAIGLKTHPFLRPPRVRSFLFISGSMCCSIAKIQRRLIAGKFHAAKRR